MENEEIIIICSKSNNELQHIDLQCFKCNEDITLSDSSIQAIKETYPTRDLVKYPPKPICIECYIKESRKDKENDILLPPTKSQLEDIINNI